MYAGPKKCIKKAQIWSNGKQKDRAVLPKQKLIFYISRSQKFFEPDFYPIFKFQASHFNIRFLI